jgi:hypothetical protein
VRERREPAAGTRATGRQKEVAVRTALGASGNESSGQLLTESVLVGVLGGAAGLAVAFASLKIVRSFNPGNIPRLDAITIDLPVLLFTFGSLCVDGRAVWPRAGVTRGPARFDDRAQGRRTQRAGRRRIRQRARRLRSLLVVAEVAFSLMLLVGAGLLTRSFVRLQQVSPGFEPEGVVSMRLGSTAQTSHERDAGHWLLSTVRGSAAAVPGVVIARRRVRRCRSRRRSGGAASISRAGRRSPARNCRSISAAHGGLFQDDADPLLQGRWFTEADLQPNDEPVAIIDEKFAKRFWPNGDAIGKHVWGDPKRPATIVGVVGTVKQYGLDVDGRIVTYRSGPERGLARRAYVRRSAHRRARHDPKIANSTRR